MSYLGISVREAMIRLNATQNGWFLPQVQRQYVWGARHESEGYVCLLLDSLKRGYPIGGVVLWETSTPVPYREFVRDYAPGQYAHQVEEGRWAHPSRLCMTASSGCRRYIRCFFTDLTDVFCTSTCFSMPMRPSPTTPASCSVMLMRRPKTDT